MNMLKKAVLIKQEEEVKVQVQAQACHAGFGENGCMASPILICHQVEVNG